MKAHRKLAYSTRRIDYLRSPADARNWIRRIEELEPGPVIVYIRESRRGQKRNLAIQRKQVIRELKAMGFVVVRVFLEVALGKVQDRPELTQAVQEAKRLQIPLVAEGVSRILRSPRYDSKFRPNEIPSAYDFDQLMSETVAEGLTLAPLAPPEATPGQERSRQTRRGQAGLGRFGGRPKKCEPGAKKALREKWLLEAIRLHARGLGYGRT